MDKSKKYAGVLNDYYGKLLTEHQREIVRLYYDMDFSLAEIGEEMGISRQGVKDVLMRSEKKLAEYETALGLYSKIRAVSERLQRAAECADAETRKILEQINKEVLDI